jgi:hypothetical protein
VSKSDATENAFLSLVYTATAWSGVADNAATGTKTHIMFGGHTADPGETGNQSTSAIAYTSAARVAKTRDTNATTGFTVTGNSVTPNSAITFPAGTGGSGTMTYFSTGFATSSTPTSGTEAIIHSGTVTPNIVCGNGITPQLTTATAITED